MINIKKVNKSYGSSTILADISFSLEDNCSVALVGPNGVGKSTLLKIIAGIEEADSGSVEISPNVSIGYMSQEMQIVEAETIEDYFKKIAGIGELEKQLNLLEGQLDCPQKTEQYHNLQETYIHLGGYAFESRIKSILAGFQLEKFSLNQPLRFLSSGQRSKIALGAILLKGIDLLLLDEPTNNLDLPALIWLENFLLNSNVACVIVSHDRKFLDRVATKVFEIDWETRNLSVHTGSYSDFLELKKRRIQRQKELYRIQQEKIAKLENTVRSKKSWADVGGSQFVSDNDKYCRGMRRDRAAKSAKGAKAIEKRIEQMDQIESPREKSPLIIPLVPQENNAKQSIRLENVVVGYNKSFGIGPINLEILYGTRVGIFGINGAGKSTLLRAITGELEIQQGTISIGSSLVIGNLMQEHENLQRDKTVFQLLKEKTKLEAQDIYHLLNRFNFLADDGRKNVGILSPGERARLLLAIFCGLSVNVLILDEPTNHLDIEANEALEEVLSTYTGTVLIVSHDRCFLEQAKITNAFILADGTLKQVSSYSEYIAEITLTAKRLINRLKLR